MAPHRKVFSNRGPAPRKRPARHRLFSRFLSGIVAVVFSCFFLLVPRSEAVDFLAELTAGYDSNPALSVPSDGSGFSVYGLGATHSFVLSEDLFLDLSAEGRYQDYWSVGDNYRLQAGTALSCALAEGWFLPSLMGEVAAYRDALIETDDRNEAMAGIGADWILSNRLTLGFEQTFRWLSYLNPAKPFSGKGQGRKAGKGGNGGNGGNGCNDGDGCNGGNGCDGGNDCSEAVRSERVWAASTPDQGPGMGNGLNRLYPPRDNLLMVTGLDLDVFILPSLTGRVSAAYGDLDSSTDMESFREVQAGGALSWTPAAQWRVGGGATWYRTEYHRVPEELTRVRRINYTWCAEAQVCRFWGDLELFGQLGWKSGDAPLDYASYTQTVIQCGLSYSF